MKVGQQEDLQSSRPRVLIADGEPSQAKQAQQALRDAGYACQVFREADELLAAIAAERAPIIVADPATLALGASEFLSRVRARSPEAVLIFLVATPAAPGAAAAMHQGAFDYLTKPVNGEELSAVVGRAVEMGGLRRENRLLHEQLAAARMAAAFIAESPRSRELATLIRRAAPARSPVLIQGPSGAGKELVAHMLHHWSNRARGPFVRLAFKSLAARDTGDLFTGAGAREGAFALISSFAQRALDGTLFLDEIGEASPEFQAALFRFIGEGASGASPDTKRNHAARVRIVAATNRNLAAEIAAGRFRPDLYFELNVIALSLPPLRERREDIVPLARHFLAMHAAETGRLFTLTPEAERALLAYSWPGNVRELEKVVERAVVMGAADRISAEALGLAQPQLPTALEPEAKTAAESETAETVAAAPRVATPATEKAVEKPSDTAGVAGLAPEPAPGAQTAPAGAPSAEQFTEGTLQECLDRAAAIRIAAAVQAAGGNRGAAASALGIDRTTLYRLMRRLGL